MVCPPLIPANVDCPFTDSPSFLGLQSSRAFPRRRFSFFLCYRCPHAPTLRNSWCGLAFRSGSIWDPPEAFLLPFFSRLAPRPTSPAGALKMSSPFFPLPLLGVYGTSSSSDPVHNFVLTFLALPYAVPFRSPFVERSKVMG